MNSREIFAKNLQHYMNINGKTRNDLSDDLKISYFTITSWCNGSKMPRIDKVQILADYFGITKAHLLESHEQAPQKNKNDDLAQIITRLRTDNDFYSLVSAIYKLNVRQFKSLKDLITAFLNK